MIAISLIVFLISIIFTSIYVFSWVNFQKYQFLERDYNIVGRYPGYSKKWHLYKALNQILFFILMLPFFGLPLTLFNMVWYWIMFDGFLNKVVLKQKFFYVGNTAKLDKTFVHLASVLKMTPEKLITIIKIFLAIVLLGLYF